MIRIQEKTLDDLEFPTVLLQISNFTVTDLGKEEVLKIIPFKTREAVLKELHRVNDYVASFENDNTIPNHRFDAIYNDLKRLAIDNTFLEVDALKRILTISTTTNALLRFFKTYKTYYPTLAEDAGRIEITLVIIEAIEAILNRFGELKDDASEGLRIIRNSIQTVQAQIQQSFTVALQYNFQNEYLDDIKESVIENKRVLAVKAMYRRKVKGALLGQSKTGSIVYIEPQSVLQYSRELQNLKYDEKQEIIKILKAVTLKIRPYKLMLEQYQAYLTHIDVVAAKAKYAQQINGILPNISTSRSFEMIEAYHPLLWLTNFKAGKKTFSQSIKLEENSRILVISGPNAGGKSITLKTVGLLQAMLQSGILVSVHERSSFYIFNTILSDIGDNQSIENHLSTYSYRLKQMNYFLKKSDENTLFLIDEFGTGSDPELGGALAETFLEIFYQRKAFGIITTHYSNLKLLANELPDMQNANMQFNQRTLEPEFKLIIGQAGSSFTFEVAQKNGIPFRLINKAKKKIERGKVRFDKTIAKLQNERTKLEKTKDKLRKNELRKQTEAEKLEGVNQKIQKKLESYQELFDSNQRLLYLGQKLDNLADAFFTSKNKKQLLDEVFKIVQIENSKRKAQSKKERAKEANKTKTVKQEVAKKVAVIRKQKKKEKQEAIENPKPRPVLKVGDSVRLLDGKSVGRINSIEKNKAHVNYGIFTTHVSVDKLELVEAAK